MLFGTMLFSGVYQFFSINDCSQDTLAVLSLAFSILSSHV